MYQRADSRAAVTGRKVPKESIAAALERCPVAFSFIAPLVDVAVEVHNVAEPVVQRVLADNESIAKRCPFDLQDCEVTLRS